MCMFFAMLRSAGATDLPIAQQHHKARVAHAGFMMLPASESVPWLDKSENFKFVFVSLRKN